MNTVRQPSVESSKLSNKWLILLTTLLGSFMVVLNGSLMNVALPYFTQYFMIDFVRAQWIISSFVLSMTISMSLTNYLSKKFGDKNVYLTGIILFLTSSILGSISWNYESVIFFRFLQGLGGGLITPISMVIVYKYFSKNERGTAMGVWGVAVMIAPTLGPVIGGTILEFSSWSLLFLINVPLCIISIILAITFIKEKHAIEQLSFDWLGFSLITVSLLTFLIAIDLLQRQTSLFSLTLLSIGILSGLWFLFHQIKITNPLIEIKILKNKGFSSSLIILAINTIAMYTILILIPIMYQDVLKETPFLSGMLLVPHALLMGLAMTIGGRTLDKRGPYLVILVGTIIMAVSSLLLFAIKDYTNMIIITIIIALHGFGCGFMSTPTTTAGLNSLKDNQIPSGSSLNNQFRQLVKVYAVFFITYFYSIYSQSSYGADVIRTIFAISGILLFLSTFFVHINKKAWKNFK